MKRQLSLYLKGDMTLEEFERWSAPILRNSGKSADQYASTLCKMVEWAFFDFERGIVTKDGLKESLSRLAEWQPPVSTILRPARPTDRALAF